MINHLIATSQKIQRQKIMVDNVVTVVKLCFQKIIQQYFYVAFQDFFWEKTVGIRSMNIQLCRIKMASLVIKHY